MDCAQNRNELLSLLMAVLGRALVPLQRNVLVRADAVAVLVHHTQLKFRVYVAISREAGPDSKCVLKVAGLVCRDPIIIGIGPRIRREHEQYNRDDSNVFHDAPRAIAIVNGCNHPRFAGGVKQKLFIV